MAAATERPDRDHVVELRPGDRLAVIAGGGRLPVELAEHLKARGKDVVIVPVVGEAKPDAFKDLNCSPIALEEFGELIGRLRDLGATHVVMAGRITRRPRLTTMRINLGLLKAIPSVALSLARGDDNLLRAIVSHIEGKGFKVVGVHDIMPDILMAEGVLTRKKPGMRDRADLAAAAEAALAIGRLDIGQAAVAIGGRVVALEGVEGTDGLLERTVTLRDHGRLAAARGGVLVKWSKPGQEERADLPAVGPETVDAVKRAGLSGIGLEAGRGILIQQAETLRRADAAGIFVVGMTEPSP